MTGFVHIPRNGGTSIRQAFGWEMSRFIHERASRLADAGRAPLFTLVRNPWERAVSLFYFFHRSQAIVRPAYFREWVAAGLPHPSGEEPVLYHGTSRAIDVRSPQVSWLDGPPVQVFRLENLVDDWLRICRLVQGRGIPYALTAPHVNRSREHPPSAKLYDRNSLELIGARYAEDVDCLGYEAPELEEDDTVS